MKVWRLRVREFRCVVKPAQQAVEQSDARGSNARCRPQESRSDVTRTRGRFQGLSPFCLDRQRRSRNFIKQAQLCVRDSGSQMSQKLLDLARLRCSENNNVAWTHVSLSDRMIENLVSAHLAQISPKE